jgi:tetratricopeptide (TPR) repeat protein
MPGDHAARWAVCQGNNALIGGDLTAAATHFQHAVALDPSVPGALLGLGKVRCGLALWQSARGLLEQALAIPSDAQAARHALWEVCQVLGDRAAAVGFLRAAVRLDPLVSRPCLAPQRRVLALNAVGDFQANLPLAPLLDPATTELHTLWLDPEAGDPSLPGGLPPFDVVFIAIAEDERHAGLLAAADRLAAAAGRPVVNSGRAIARLSRDGTTRLLAGLPDAIVPPQRLVSRGDPIGAYPVIIRPRRSHAGEGLARLDDDAALAAYLAAHPEADAFFVAPFIDYRSPDGQWRKYRIIFVDGEPLPFHLAIHSGWAVWYYNAGMAEDAAKRAEEAMVIQDLASAFPPRAMTALRELGRRVGLDYFGLDCSLMPDGRLLIFEVETGMLVHDADPRDLYPYKEAAVARIFRAVEAMLDRRIASAQAA